MDAQPSASATLQIMAPADDLPNVRLESTPHDKLWMDKYRKLEAFRQAYGHCRVPQSFEDKALASWVGNQKSLQVAGTLKKDREKVLNELGFTWSKPYPKKKEVDEEAWMEKYKQVVAFKERNGHIRITIKEDAKLNRWLRNQRLAYRSGNLHKERQVLLDKTGFVWNVNPGPRIGAPLNSVQNDDEAWNNMYAKLLEYSLQYGHADIQADSEDQELVQWVFLQRILCKHGHLEEKREKDLCDIGLTWEPHVLDESGNHERHKDEELWLSQFRLLCEFKKQHGHISVPHTGETHALAQWLFVQQRLMEKGRLPEDKKNRLMALYFTKRAVPVIDMPTAMRSEASAVKLDSVDNDMSTSLRNEAPNTKQSARYYSNSPAAFATTRRTHSEAPTAQKSVSVSRVSKVATAKEGGTHLEASSSSLKIGQKFPVGTRIEKAFELDGVWQAFSGKVIAFERFKEEDGNKARGYLIRYSDGDEEHMLEANVAKYLVAAKNKKRAAKGQAGTSPIKRVKHVNASGIDASSIALKQKMSGAVLGKVNTKLSTKPGSTIQLQKTGRSSTGSTQDHVKSRKRAEKKKAPGKEDSSRVSRLRDAKLPRKIKKRSVATKSPAASNLATKVPMKQPPLNNPEGDASSSDDELLISLVRKRIHFKDR